MTLMIRGIATATTPYQITHQRALELAQAINHRKPEPDSWLNEIYRHAEIANRSMCVPHTAVDDVLSGVDEHGYPFFPKSADDFDGPTTSQRMEYYWQAAAPMAELAAQRALQDANLSPAAVTHLIVVTCTGFQAPGLDWWLMTRLPLSPSVERTQVGFMGCQGAFNGLRVANAFTTADPAAVVLVVAVEVCTVHYHYGREAKRLIGNAIFADGAGAVVATGESAANAHRNSRDRWRMSAVASHLLPDTHDAMRWTIGDHGFEMELAPEIPGLIAEHIPAWLDGWLANLGLRREAVGSWAIHPGGPKILRCIQTALNISQNETEVSWRVFSQHGNMSSATILFLLEHLRSRGAPRPCIALGFGPGMVVEGILWK